MWKLIEDVQLFRVAHYELFTYKLPAKLNNGAYMYIQIHKQHLEIRKAESYYTTGENKDSDDLLHIYGFY